MKGNRAGVLLGGNDLAESVTCIYVYITIYIIIQIYYNILQTCDPAVFPKNCCTKELQGVRLLCDTAKRVIHLTSMYFSNTLREGTETAGLLQKRKEIAGEISGEIGERHILDLPNLLKNPVSKPCQFAKVP